MSLPNLLYIHSDQHNPYVTGCYGDDLVKTPNLDKLVSEGVVLENVLEGWNPDEIKLQMEEKRLDTQILSRWTRHTQPVDQYRWNLLPEMDYLD